VVKNYGLAPIVNIAIPFLSEYAQTVARNIEGALIVDICLYLRMKEYVQNVVKNIDNSTFS
jgi:hypothetical protein